MMLALTIDPYVFTNGYYKDGLRWLRSQNQVYLQTFSFVEAILVRFFSLPPFVNQQSRNSLENQLRF